MPSKLLCEELRHAAKVTGIFLAQAPPSDPLTLHQGGGGRNLSLKNSGTRTGENWNDKRCFECMNTIFKNKIAMKFKMCNTIYSESMRLKPKCVWQLHTISLIFVNGDLGFSK